LSWARARIRHIEGDIELDYQPYRERGVDQGRLYLRIFGDERAPEARFVDASGQTTHAVVRTSYPGPVTSGPKQTPKSKRQRDIETRDEQSGFRESVLLSFGGCCAISGLEDPRALEAAHLATFETARDNTVGNGVLLRRDLHALFDANQLGLAPPKNGRGCVVFASSALERHYEGYRTWHVGSAPMYLEAVQSRWHEFLASKAAEDL
jgi:hypothetical protein